MKRAVSVLLAVGTALTGATYALASAVVFPTPVTSISAFSVKSPDSAAVVVAYTRRCVLVGGVPVCPSAWDVSVSFSLSAGEWGGMSRRTRTALRDTVRFARSVCPVGVTVAYMTIRATVAAIGTDKAERSRDGVGTVPVRCRAVRAIELAQGAAMADTFPQVDRRMTLADWMWKTPSAELAVDSLLQIRSAKTAADTQNVYAAFRMIRLGPDSVYYEQPLVAKTDTAQVRAGYIGALCYLVRNRFDGKVYIVDPALPQCESVRQRYEVLRGVVTPPPPPAGALDTLRRFRTASGALRPTVAGIDSQYAETHVDRVAPTGDTVRVFLRSVWNNAWTDSARYAGMTVTTAHGCPLKPTERYGGSWDIIPRAAVGNVVPVVRSNAWIPAGYPTLVFSRASAEAMAAQLAVDSLAVLARDGYLTAVVNDAAWTNGRVWYEECFGAIPP